MWTWCLHRVPDDKREEWVVEMNAPLPLRPGQVPTKRQPTQAELDAEGESFMSFMASHTSRKG